VSERESLPLSVRAVVRYYAETGVFDLRSLTLKRQVDDEMDAVTSDAYGAVEAALERELDMTGVSFEYETKLTMPVELTLGYLYREAITEAPDDFDPVSDTPSSAAGDGHSPAAMAAHEKVQSAEQVTVLVTEALLEGDMRDALNDEEYEDFVVDTDVTDAERREIARVAREALHERVEERFDAFPDRVREEYERAVEASERHQSEDEHFRQLLHDASDGDAAAIDAIENEYKFAAFETDPDALTPEERAFPYCKTQYERVGVIYDGMIEMFRAAGLDIEEQFKHSIILAIIGAQVWLDDVDDYHSDMREEQLTPITAEYLINESDQQAYQQVLDISLQYFDAAIDYARESDSTLTGIATEYIYLSGDPELLPGSE
jgi:hypothetical protein